MTDERPFLQVVRGDATPEEIAALVAVVASITGATAARSKPKPRSVWADPARRMRTRLAPGAGAWRASGLPR